MKRQAYFLKQQQQHYLSQIHTSSARLVPLIASFINSPQKYVMGGLFGIIASIQSLNPL